MKTVLKKTILYAVVALTFVLGNTFAFAQGIAPGDDSRPAYHPGNVAQPLELLKITGAPVLLDNGSEVGFNTSIQNTITQFMRPGSVMTVLGNMFVEGQTFLGDSLGDTQWVEFSSVLGINQSLPMQDLNVDGKVLATSLSHDANPEPLHNICVGPSGVLILCPEFSGPVGEYAWQTGTWGECINDVRTRTVECIDVVTGDVVEDSFCAEPKPDETQPCVNGQCQSFPSAYPSQPADETNGCLAGEFNELDPSDTEFLWECQGSNGGTTDSCSATIDTTTPPTAQCGPSNGQTFSSVPTTGLCDPGTVSEVTTTSIPEVEGICTGTYTTTGSTQEVDWNGSPFNADPYALYTADGTKIAQCSSEISIIGTPTSDDRYFLRNVIGATPPYKTTSYVNVPFPNNDDSYVDNSFYCERLISSYNSVSGPVYVQGTNVNWTALTLAPADFEAEITAVATMQGSYINSSGGQTYQCSNLSPNNVEDYCLNAGYDGCVWDPGSPASITYEWTCTEGTTSASCLAFGSSCDAPTLISLSPGTPGDVTFDLGGQTNVDSVELYSLSPTQTEWSFQGTSSTTSPGQSAILDGWSIKARSVCSDGSVSEYSNILEYNA